MIRALTCRKSFSRQAAASAGQTSALLSPGDVLGRFTEIVVALLNVTYFLAGLLVKLLRSSIDGSAYSRDAQDPPFGHNLLIRLSSMRRARRRLTPF